MCALLFISLCTHPNAVPFELMDQVKFMCQQPLISEHNCATTMYPSFYCFHHTLLTLTTVIATQLGMLPNFLSMLSSPTADLVNSFDDFPTSLMKVRETLMMRLCSSSPRMESQSTRNLIYLSNALWAHTYWHVQLPWLLPNPSHPTKGPMATFATMQMHHHQSFLIYDNSLHQNRVLWMLAVCGYPFKST